MSSRSTTSRVYIFTITALAVFLAGITIWRVPVRGYVIRASVGGPVSDRLDHDVDWEARVSAIRDTVNLLAILQHVGLGDSAHVHAPDISDAEAVRQQLSVELRRAAPGRVEVDLALHADDPQWAVTFVNHLTGQFASSGPRLGGPHDSSFGGLRLRWKEARHYERKARFELDGHLGQMMRQLEAGGTHGVGTGDSSPEKAKDNDRDWPPQPEQADKKSALPVVPGAEPQPNAAWTELKTKWDELTLERDLLLTRRTTAHPEVVEVTAMIRDIEQRMESIPRYLAPREAAAPREAEGVSDGGDSGRSGMLVLAELAAASRQYERLRADYELAVRRLEKIESEWQAGAATGTATPHAPQQRWVVEPARVAEHVGGRPSALRVAIIGLAAMLAGFGATWLSASLRSLHCLVDVQRELPIPLVGYVSTADEDPNHGRHTRRQAWSRRLTLACEVALGACACVTLAAAVAASPVTGEFAADPFGTIADTMVRVASGRFLLDL